MPQRDTDAGPLLLRLTQHAIDFRVGHRVVRRVLDFRHAALLGTVTHGAHEHTGASALRTPHFGQEVVQHDAGLRQPCHISLQGLVNPGAAPRGSCVP